MHDQLPPRTNGPESDSAITGFAAKVSRYFLDFLETDFKKQRVPHRKIQLKNDAGFRTGLPLRKYRTLSEAVWKILSTPVGELPPLRLPRGRYTAPISGTLRDLIRQHVDSLEGSGFETVRQETLGFARRARGTAVENPEDYVEDVQTSFVESVGQYIVTPILALLDGPFRQQSYSAIESVYEVETDLVDALAVQVVEQLPTALNTFILSSDLGATEKVLEEFFSEMEAKERVKAFFEDLRRLTPTRSCATLQTICGLAVRTCRCTSTSVSCVSAQPYSRSSTSQRR